MLVVIPFPAHHIFCMLLLEIMFLIAAHLIPAVFKSQAWGVLHALLEIIVFRVHLQLQYSYRFQLLQQLHTVASVSIIPTQLYGSTENAALRLIKGLNSPEFLIQLAKQFANDPKPVSLA